MKLGLPSAAELLQSIEAEASTTASGNLKKDWSHWCEFRDSCADTALRFLLNVPNPEIILSALDLITLASEDYWSNWFTVNHEAFSTDDHLSLGTDVESAAHHLKECIETCLHHWCWRASDLKPSAIEPYADLFSDVEPGDVVITFNWDWLAEWILARRGLWNPTTGYGLEFRLSSHFDVEDRLISPIPTEVMILKLHGSIGWRRKPAPFNGTPGPIRFDRTGILKNIPFHRNGGDDFLLFGPPKNEQAELYDTEPSIIYPTYLKAVPGDAQLQRIWHQAADALARADTIILRGYSLPASDSAARTLLNPLASRFQAREVKVDGIDASKTTCQRWDHFLGSPDKEVFKCDTF